MALDFLRRSDRAREQYGDRVPPGQRLTEGWPIFTYGGTPHIELKDWKFVVIQDPQTRQALVQACKNQKFIAQAPVVIAACSSNPGRKMASGQLASTTDLSIAVDHMTLAAVELGLGTCWIGSFDATAVAKLLDLPYGIARATVQTSEPLDDNVIRRPSSDRCP